LANEHKRAFEVRGAPTNRRYQGAGYSMPSALHFRGAPRTKELKMYIGGGFLLLLIILFIFVF